MSQGSFKCIQGADVDKAVHWLSVAGKSNLMHLTAKAERVSSKGTCWTAAMQPPWACWTLQGHVQPCAGKQTLPAGTMVFTIHTR